MDRPLLASPMPGTPAQSLAKKLLVAVLLALTFGAVLTAADMGSATADGGETTTILVRARGQTADERIELVVGDEVVASWDATLEWQEFGAAFPEPESESTVAVRFPNDAYVPPYDRNLEVDYIVVDGQRYETEHPDSLSTGSFHPSEGCKAGNHRTQILSCTGEFIYSVDGRAMAK